MLNSCLNIIVRFINEFNTSSDGVVTHLHEAPHSRNILKVFAKERATGTIPYARTDTRHVYHGAHNSAVVLESKVDLKCVQKRIHRYAYVE